MIRTSRLFLIAPAFAAGALGVLFVECLTPQAYRKDLQQPYLAALALRDGVDIFTPITELSARYFPAPTDNFPHPSPYPPVLALLSLPLTLLPFPAVALMWLAVNVGLSLKIGRWCGLSFAGSLALTAWPPLWYLFLIGQFELLVLALAMLGWRAARAGRQWRAGLWLGLAAAIKLYPALLLVPFLARRRLRLLLAAGAVFALSQLGNLATVGTSGFVRYYEDVLPAVSARYVRIGLNSSPYGGLLRVFGGATDVAPVIHASGLVVPLTIMISLFALGALAKMEPEAAPVAILVALPSVWYYYVVLALPQIVTLLRSSDLRRGALTATAAASFVLPLVYLLLQQIVPLLSPGGSQAPPVAALLAAVQPAGFVGLLVLSMRMYMRARQHRGPLKTTARGESTQ